jgi:hypothetical protein
MFRPNGGFILFGTIKPDQSAFIEPCFGHSGSSGAGDKTGTLDRDLAGANHTLRPTIDKEQRDVCVYNHRDLSRVGGMEASSSTILSADIFDDISGYILMNYTHFPY